MLRTRRDTKHGHSPWLPTYVSVTLWTTLAGEIAALRFDSAHQVSDFADILVMFLVSVVIFALSIGASVSLQLAYRLIAKVPDEWGTPRYPRVLLAFRLFNVLLCVGAAVAVVLLASQGVQASSSIAIGTLIIGLGGKTLTLLIVGIVIPILKSIPALVFGLIAKDWWEKRKERQRDKEN